MSEQRPVTITAKQFVAGDYAAKIARGECVVTDPVGDVIIGNWIGNEDYIWLTWKDKHGIKGNSGYTYTVPLTVTWLTQPEREEAAPLLPQTVRDGDATLLGSKSIISPSEFLSGEYAYKIACDECQVTCFGQRIRTLSKRDDKGNYMIWPLNDSEVSGMAHDDDKLIVTWFPHTEDEWHEVGVKLDREEAAAREFADGWRDAEIARLQAELTDVKSENAQLRNTLAELGYLA